MKSEDATLQELIVRALTGMDKRARQALETASKSDPELKQFFSELDEVVNLLAGSNDWRAAPPPPEVRERVRQAVAQKMPRAPQHFRTVVMESEMGRRRTLMGLIVAGAILLGVLILIGALITFNKGGEGERALKLTGTLAYETSFKTQDDLRAWATRGDPGWLVSTEGLHTQGGEDPSALVLLESFDAAQAGAIIVDVNSPGLDTRSSLMVFLSEGSGGEATLNTGARPTQGLALEVTRESLVLFAPDQGLLQSRPVSNAEPRFLRLRIEHLGPRVRVLINGETLYDGMVSRPLRGKLYPGIRVAGPQKNQVRFNAFRVER
jgi:hypothetical protein